MPILSDAKLIKQFEEHKRISESGISKQHRKDKTNYAFFHGNEATYRTTIADRGRKRTVVFNKVKPFVDSVTGVTIQLRRKPEYQARIAQVEAQLAYSTAMTGISDYIRDEANMDQIETRQYRATFICGWAATDQDITYENNPDGDVLKQTIDYDSYWWDPQSKEPNLMDRRWDYWEKKYNRDEAVQRFKGSTAEDFEAAEPNSPKDYVWNPDGGSYDKISESDWANYTQEDLVGVYKYQWYALDTYYRCKNPLYGIQDPGLFKDVARLAVTMIQTRAESAGDDYADDMQEFDLSAEWLIMTPLIKKDMELLFDEAGFEVEYQMFLKRCYYTAIISKKKVLKKYKSSHQGAFSTDVTTGTYDPDRKQWYGLVDSIREPAKYSNKALTEMLYVIASNSKGGVMYEKSAVRDKARFEQQYAKTDSSVEVEDGALQKGAIKPKINGALPQSYEKIYEISEESLSEVSGINKEFLGLSDTSDPTAVLEAQRINKVLTTLADYFDSFTLSQKNGARWMETAIRILAENSEGRLIAIVGPDGAKAYTTLSQDKLADEYDVTIGEAPTTPAQQNLTRTVLSSMATAVQPMGINLWPIVAKHLPISQADKKEVLAAMTPNPQVQQAQQQAALAKQQQEAQLNDAVVKGQIAEAAKNIAMAQLNAAKIPSAHADAGKTINDAERIGIENNMLRKFPEDAIKVTI